MSAAPDTLAAAPGSSPGQALFSGPKLEALAELCRRFHVRTLHVFGSAVTGRFDPARSDLDFLVEFEEPCPPVPGDRWFGFGRELEALFGRPVDVLFESSLKNPFLRRSVEATKRRLFPPPAEDWSVSVDPAMSEKQPAKYLWDAIESAARIERFTQGRTFDDYLSDEMFRAAVERQFEIIGEALGALRRLASAIASKVPNLNQIVAFRNILVHMYSDIHNDKVWNFIERDLPNLRATLERLLAEASGA